jgi:hypothetical protein
LGSAKPSIPKEHQWTLFVRLAFLADYIGVRIDGLNPSASKLFFVFGVLIFLRQLDVLPNAFDDERYGRLQPSTDSQLPFAGLQ